MEIDIVWLGIGIAVFFALGWVAGRIDLRQLLRESRALPRSYFRGLNFLLNEQPDKAIEAFLEAAKLDPETVEIHFALGSLFRRRGETDRAIRVHKNLVERDGLNEEQRLHALAELGQDYLKAGLLDRAEDIFLRLRHTRRDEEALRSLLEVYQQEKEWAKAIDIAQAMPDHAEHAWLREIAEFHCEEASREMVHERFDQAAQQLEQALAANRKCVRASLLQGDLAAAQGRDEDAIAAWMRVEEQNPEYLSLVAEKLKAAHQRLGRDEQGMRLLRGYLQRHPSLDLLDTVFQAEIQAGNGEGAYHMVREELRRNPTLLGLDKLLEAQVLVAPADQRADLELLKNLIHGHTRRVARYRCDSCGFKARQFYWRCPACGGWESYPPKRTEEFDLTP